MTLRQRIFLTTGMVAGIAIIVIGGLLLTRKRAEAPGGEDNTTGASDTTTTSVTTAPASLVQKSNLPSPSGGATVSPIAEMPPEERYAKQIATIFVERFGSSSNQNNNSHIESVRTLVTPRMNTFLNTQMQVPGTQYAGVTTDVIAAEITSLTESAATVTIEAQQRIEDAAGERTEQKKGRVELVKSGNEWKVDGFFWE